MNLFASKIENNYTTQPQTEINTYVSDGVNNDFEESIFSCAENLKGFSDVAKSAMDEIDNIIILKNKNSTLPSEFSATENKFIKYASDSYGFVSRKDAAIVVIQDNHNRKNIELEGSLEEQAADTFAHEVGHIIDKELSTTEEFKKAYLADLKNIHSILQENPNQEIYGENLKEILTYLEHYIDGVNFEDGISEDDITRTGLRENFSECFSTIVDTNPSKINGIFSTLFTNTMAQTRAFIV